MSPTARSLAILRKRGALYGVVEKWNPGARVRQDFLGFADVLAIQPGQLGVLAIQVCSNAGGDVSGRVRKITTAPVAARARVWLAAGNRITIHGWAKQGPRGKRKTWTLRELDVTADDVHLSPNGA